MSTPNSRDRRPARISASALVLLAACTMQNPAFDDLADETRGGDESNPGDGDPSTTGGPSTTGDGDPSTTGDDDPTSTGDGDGEAESSSTGDGDPSTTGDGDGDGDPVQCAEGLNLCDGDCVDFETDNASCGGCGLGCDDATICALGGCLPKRYVFATSVQVTGAFGGSGPLDELCNDLALEAQLPGIYKAWISDANQFPAQSFSPSPGAFVLPNGPLVAPSWSAFISGQLLAPINRNEFGLGIVPAPVDDCGLDYAVWTGTTNTGLPAEPQCGGWDNAAMGLLGIVGNAQSKTAWSNTECPAPCGVALPVYCVQQ